MINRNAQTPRTRTHRRDSRNQIHVARMSVRIETVPAARRWLHSQRIPPTMGGKAEPFASGHVGMDRPA